jgi:hypothetical protein
MGGPQQSSASCLGFGCLSKLVFLQILRQREHLFLIRFYAKKTSKLHLPEYILRRDSMSGIKLVPSCEFNISTI